MSAYDPKRTLAAPYLVLAYMIPFVLTINEAAAPPSSLAFMFWEGIFVFPLMLLYTFVSYTVFRGKVPSTSQIHH